MAITKEAYRLQVLNAADARTSQRWDAAAGGEVDFLIATAFDREWRRILNAYPVYKTNTVTLDSSSGGSYLKSALSDPDDERLFRIIAVKRDNIVYKQENFLENTNSITYDPSRYTWWDEGSRIQLLPVVANVEAEFIVSVLPRSFLRLDETDDVEFPDGYEMIPIFEAAGLMLASKAGAEHNSALELKQIAQEYREDMLSDLARISTNPMVIRYDDDSYEWGGS